MPSVSIEMKKAGAWPSLAVLLAGNFITILDVFIVNVALASIQRDLQASDAELQLVIVAYGIPYGALLLNGARLGDLYGRRRLFLVGMGIFALGSLACALALSPPTLIGARAIQGVGAALLMPQVYTSLRLLFEDDDRRRAFAIMGAVQGVAGVASQVIGGFLIALNIGDLGWRLVFLVNLPVAIYALIAGKWMIAESRAFIPARLDLGGAALGSAAFSLILLSLTVGREQQWPWWSIVGALASIPLFVCFASHEARLVRYGGVPIIDIALFKKEEFTLGILATFLFFSTIGSFSLSLTILLQVGLGQTALEAGTMFVPSAVSFFIGSLLSAPLAKKWGHMALLLGLCVFAVGLAISVFVGLAGGRHLDALIASLVLNGLGQGIAIPLLLGVVLGAVSDDEAGMASGAFSTMQIAGSSFGVTIVGVILFSVLNRSSEAIVGEFSGPAIYGKAFALATIYNLTAVILGGALFSRLRRSPRREAAK